MLLICFGTRPEYIKVRSLIETIDNIRTCFTGQHHSILQDVSCDIYLDYNINTHNNSLNRILINVLNATNIFDDVTHVIVQGDTSSAFAVALSAFHHNIPVIHLEAGLRTYDISDPYPEELNRQLISRIATIHLCPTEYNKKCLISEGISRNVYVTGNTGLDCINRNNCEYGNLILVTMHRRDNLSKIYDWFVAFNKLAELHPHLEFLIPLHPNPIIRKHKHILKNITVTQPLPHEQLIDLLKRSMLVISDSGGLQEEASFLNKRIIICRNTTERVEVLESHGILCPTPEKLSEIFRDTLHNPTIDKDCPFGNGTAYKKVIDVLVNHKII